jgi:hypothetical protein
VPPRILRRESDGGLYDVDERRRVSVAELRDELRTGRRFRASRHDSGANCTNEVLAEVLQAGVFPGVKGEGAGLGAGVSAGMGPLAAVLGTIGGGIVDALENSRGGTDGRPLSSVRRRRPARREPMAQEPELVDPEPE